MKKINYLEGVRGIAAFMVIFNHFMVAFFPATYWGSSMPTHLSRNIEIFLAQSPLNVFSAGNFAVCIFFILSGFVLSYSYFLNNNNNEKLTKSAIKRYPRLVLPVLIIIIIVAIFINFSFFYNKEASLITGSSTWLATFFNFNVNIFDVFYNAFYNVPFNGSAKYLTVLWTINFELIGSFITYLFLLLFGKLEKRYIFYIAFILVFYKTYFLAFILGIILADIFCNKKGILLKSNKVIITLILILAAIYFGGYPSGIEPTNKIYGILVIANENIPESLIYHTIGAFLLLFAVLSSNILQKILELKPFVFLGKISFSIYLIHVVIIGSFSSYIFIKIYEQLNRYLISFGITVIISIPLILLLSYVFEKYIVENTNKISKKIEEKIYGKQKIK